MIQKLGKPLGIPQKEPAHHCLKSRGPAIARRITASGAPAGPVAAAAHQFPLLVIQKRLQLLQRPGLGLGPHPGHHRLVQLIGAARLLAVAQPLVQFPDRIPQPGQLEGAEALPPLGIAGIGLDLAQPGPAVGIRAWQGRPGPC